MSGRTSKQRGFTLAEVLVALALLALLATMAWRGVTSMSEAKQASEARVEETLRLGTVMAQWEQDLQQLHDPGLLPQALQFDGATLRLVRRQPGGLQVVAWAVREARWTRWASPVTDNAASLQEFWLSSLQLLGNEREQLTLVDGMGGWQVYFYRTNAWTNAQSSAGTVSGQNPGTGVVKSPLPTGVRVVLTLQQGNDNQAGRTLTRDVLLAPQPLP